jgi:threonine dehydrogenase-like Zn-dependent dehydrogenase
VLTANTWEAYRLSLEIVRYMGRISILGFPGRAQPAPAFNPLDARWVYGKQLTLAGAGHLSRIECAPSDIRFNLRRDLEFVLDLLASGDLRLGAVISHRFRFERMKEAYELAGQHSNEFRAAVFDWRRAQEQ